MVVVPIKPGDESLEAEILAYLRAHPHAMDTLGGIAEWWLDRKTLRSGSGSLFRVLGRLVERGVLETVDGQNEPLYRLRNTAKRLGR